MPAVRDVIQAVEVDELSVAELWLLRSHHRLQVFLLLHFLELGHFNEDLMDLLV